MNPWFESLLTASWQAGVIAGLVGLASVLLRKWLSPRVRYCLWFLVVIRLACPSFPASSTSVFNFLPKSTVVEVDTPPEAEATLPAAPPPVAKVVVNEPEMVLVAAPATERPLAPPPWETPTLRSPIATEPPPSSPVVAADPGWTWSAILLAIWASGVLALSLRLAVSWLKLKRLIANAEEIESGLPINVLRAYRPRFRIRRSIRILQSHEIKGPALYGILRPCLLLPAETLPTFTAAELEMIFAHELSHIRRWDNATNWLTTILQILHWFNPMIWLAFWQMRYDREMATDQLALSVVGEDRARDYGETIINLLAHLHKPAAIPGVIGILEDGSQAKQRIRLISVFRVRSSWTIFALLVTAVMVFGCLTDPSETTPVTTPTESASEDQERHSRVFQKRAVAAIQREFDRVVGKINEADRNLARGNNLAAQATLDNWLDLKEALLLKAFKIDPNIELTPTGSYFEKIELRRGDRIRLSVQEDQSLGGVYRLDRGLRLDGFGIGFDIVGLTPPHAAREIGRILEATVFERATVNVVRIERPPKDLPLEQASPPFVVHREGEFVEPGVYLLSGSEMELEKLLAAAGGTSPIADLSKVIVQRGDHIRMLDLDPLQPSAKQPGFSVVNGDIVLVPRIRPGLSLTDTHNQKVSLRVLAEEADRYVEGFELRVGSPQLPHAVRSNPRSEIPAGPAHILYDSNRVTQFVVDVSKEGYGLQYAAFDAEKFGSIPGVHTVRLGKAAAIGGHVVDADRFPIEGARVTVSLADSLKKVAKDHEQGMGWATRPHVEKTDKNGRWFCRHVPIGIQPILTIEHAEFVTHTDSEPKPGDTYLLHVLQKPRAAVLAGSSKKKVVYLVGEFLAPGAIPMNQDAPTTLLQTVLKSGGTTAAADLARVRVHRKESGEEKVYEFDLAALLSGEQEISSFRLQTGDRIMAPPHHATTGKTLSSTAQIAARPKPAKSRQQEVSDSPLITIRVVDSSGKPIDNAEVYFGNPHEIMNGDDPRYTTRNSTDSAGVATKPVGENRYGRIGIAVEAKGFAPGMKWVEFGPTGTTNVLKLGEPWQLFGTVVDLNGSPIEGVEISADRWRRFRYPKWSTKSDANGRFALADLPADEVYWNFQKDGYMSVSRAFMASKDSQQIVLAPPLYIHGHVRDAVTGEPIPRFRIIPGVPNPLSRSAPHDAVPHPMWFERRQRHGSNGFYGLKFNHSSGVDNFVFKLEADGYAPRMTDELSPYSGAVTRDIELSPSSAFMARLLNPEGRPTKDALVLRATSRSAIRIKDGKIDHSSLDSTYLKLDAAGRFAVSDSLDPSFYLALSENGFVFVSEKELRRTRSLRLQKWGRIEGRLRIENRIGANEEVFLWHPGRFTGSRRPGSPVRLQRNYRANTDNQGRFVFEKVPPGVYSIVRRVIGSKAPGMRLSGFDPPLGRRLTTVKLNAGENKRVKLGGIGTTLGGSLEKLPGMDDEAWKRVQATVFPVLPEVPVPDHLRGVAQAEWVEKWFWSDAAENYRMWTGRPPEALDSTGRLTTFEGGWAVDVSEGGRFEIEDLPPGQYRLLAHLRQLPPAGETTMWPGRNAAVWRQRFLMPVREGHRVHLAEIPGAPLGGKIAEAMKGRPKIASQPSDANHLLAIKVVDQASNSPMMGAKIQMVRTGRKNERKPRKSNVGFTDRSGSLVVGLNTNVPATYAFHVVADGWTSKSFGFETDRGAAPIFRKLALKPQNQTGDESQPRGTVKKEFAMDE